MNGGLTILHYVSDNTILVKVATTTFRPKRLLHCDLYRINVSVIPHRRE